MARQLFGIWTILVALTVSVVAAYYSIVGLTAIFAASAFAVIVMGVSLEVAKITAAVWLHSFWHEAQFLTKAYLTCATVVLMLITSMGIFGFLSKAHIEQSAGAGQLTARIERVDQDLQRRELAITRAEQEIQKLAESVNTADTSIQDRIEDQTKLIADIESRLERGRQAQYDIIAAETGQSTQSPENLIRIEQRLDSIRNAQINGEVEELQRLIGAQPDGVFGPATQQRLDQTVARLTTEREEILAERERLRTATNPRVDQARAEIQRLQTAASADVARAQAAIDRFREQQINVTTIDNTAEIEEQQVKIETARNEIDELVERKFELESEVRKIEVEVGPVKYIAELVYGDSNPELLEEAVRWVIILLVFVFDPLAVVLILAGISIVKIELPEVKIVDEPEPKDSEPEPEAPKFQSKTNLSPETPPSINITRRPTNS